VCHRILDVNVRQYSNKPTLPKGRNHLYNLLKVTPHSSQQQIKTAYYKLCQLYHPDKKEGDSKENHEKFTEISEAYQTLSDPKSKKIYDREQQVGALRAPVNQTTNHSDGFSQDEISKHQRNNKSTQNYDNWTKSYYRDQLDRQDYRANRDRMRRDSLDHLDKGDGDFKIALVALAIVASGFGYLVSRYKDK